MGRLVPLLAVVFLTLSAPAGASVITFNTDPFAGSDALTTPGRQIVGGEPSISFDIAADIFAFDPSVFGIGDTILFANDVAANLPTSDVNVIVLRTFDDDNNPLTLFGAGNAANLIAAQITEPGPGFFIYFNQNLNLPRLVFSTDLSENTSDLKILARLTNLSGQSGALADFQSDNFQILQTPEPTSLALTALAGSLWCASRRRRRRG